MTHHFADLKHNVFARHSNPWSAWTRWLSTPLVLVPLSTRQWSHAAIVGAWMAANPVIFPNRRTSTLGPPGRCSAKNSGSPSGHATPRWR